MNYFKKERYFSKVIFGNSHPGTQVNLLKKDVDVATFAIPKSFTTYELVSGEENKNWGYIQKLKLVHLHHLENTLEKVLQL